MLKVAGADSSSSRLVVHIAPNTAPFTELGDSVQLPDWLIERWKVLTVQFSLSEGSGSSTDGNSLQQLTLSFHFGPTDCLSFAKVGFTFCTQTLHKGIVLCMLNIG